MKTITRKEAAELGLASATTNINLVQEPGIAESIMADFERRGVFAEAVFVRQNVVQVWRDKPKPKPKPRPASEFLTTRERAVGK